MRPILLLQVVLLLAMAAPGPSATAAEMTAGAQPLGAKVQVWFSPDGGCTTAIVNELRDTKRTVLIQAYSFTSVPIARAMVEAHRRGVQVRVILDSSQRTEKYSSADFLANAGIEVLIDEAHAIAHNKVMVLDGERVITGSFNFTKAAEDKNAENVVLLRSQEIAATYAANWMAHQAHSQRYTSHAERAQP